ncbi:MAG: biotin-dependent carboxyltransferase family protein [Ornithinimicrobium sp.]
MSALEIIEPGPQALVQDAGRSGWAAIGVGRCGAADRSAYELGARLVAHEAGTASLEVTLGGLVARVHGSMTVALTGADAGATVDGNPVAHACLLDLRDGQELRLGMPSAGLRTYLTARGGWDVPAVLGSRSTDTLSGVGPAPVKAGDLLRLGHYRGSYPNVDAAPVPLPRDELMELSILPGPRLDWFASSEPLTDQEWIVSDRSNRIGIRLQGDAVARSEGKKDVELPSEGMVRGALQVPPDGQPVLFGNDHPVTGGYPVIAVVPSADMDRAAQLRPGQPVRLRWAR